jgi:hypothetical protein
MLQVGCVDAGASSSATGHTFASNAVRVGIAAGSAPRKKRHCCLAE